MLSITNTTKAHIIAAVNALLGLLIAFDVGSLTDAKQGALLVAVDTVLSLFVGVTYKQSKKRLPDPTTVAPPPTVP